MLKKIEKILSNNKNFEKKNGIWIDKSNTNYAINFGIQWNEFSLTQFDSFTKNTNTEDRLYDSSKWEKINLKGAIVLELGSGAGRFTEKLLEAGAHVVTVEMSSAITVNFRNNKSNNIIFINASIFDLNFLKVKFDYVLCYGVAQHTPDPDTVYKICASFLKKGGKLSIDHYLKLYHPSPFYHPKYLWRPLTTRLNPNLLLKIIRFYITVYLPLDILIVKLLPKKLSYIIRGLIPIPCWNYYGVKNIPQNYKTLKEWAIMDTFDALGAKYDYPYSIKQVHKIAETLEFVSFDIFKGGNGLILNAKK